MCYLFTYDHYIPFLEIGGFFVSIVTLILAWEIYQNFDVKKSFINEQLKVVCGLSNDLSDFGIYCLYISGGVAQNYPRFFDFFKGDLNGDKRFQKIYFFTMHPIEVLPFIKYGHNILLPKSIATIIKQFDVNIFNSIERADLHSSYTLINSEDSKIAECEHFYYYMEYDEFYKLSKKMVDEIIKWLSKYGAKNINIPDHMKNK